LPGILSVPVNPASRDCDDPGDEGAHQQDRPGDGDRPSVLRQTGTREHLGHRPLEPERVARSLDQLGARAMALIAILGQRVLEHRIEDRVAA
jgi:hypothetical protein